MRKLILLTLLCLLTIPIAQAQTESTLGQYPPPQYATDQTLASIAVPRANLRNGPNVNSVVVDIARIGERYPIVGVFFPDTNTVRDPLTDDLVFDDIGEREVWYLLDVNGGRAWVFGGIVLITNPDGLPGEERNLTPEEQARLDEQLAIATGTIGVKVSARLRSGPGSGYPVVGLVPYLGRVTVIGRNEYGTWLYVNYGSSTGWISVYLIAPPAGYNLQAVPVVR